jgi:two-component system sensor histidine kinase QseC
MNGGPDNPAVSAAERRRSLRWRLLAAVSAAVLLIWLLTGVLSYYRSQHEAEELMDGSLAQTARLLLALVVDNDAQLPDLTARLATVRGAADNIYEPPLEFQIGHGGGQILARSANAPRLPILGVVGYSDIVREAESWRVLNVASTDGRYRVQVSQSIGLRDLAALEVAGRTVWPLAVILPLLLVLVYLSIRSGLRPLDRLAADVAARSPDNLAPLSRHEVPTEAGPLVVAINRLFGRVGRTLENERRFTADAAHELRTPLAALKVQTQVARMAEEPAMRDHALQQIENGVDRAGHLVEQLLRLARLDPLQRMESAESVPINRTIHEVLDAVCTAHPDAERRYSEILPLGALAVRGDTDLLRIALRNLLENAVRYTRPGDAIRIEAETSGDRVNLAIRDSGPGVEPADLPRLGERFFRGSDNRAQGSGLGLAIVARIAELHGARLRLDNAPDGGFIARLEGLSAATPAAGSAPT